MHEMSIMSELFSSLLEIARANSLVSISIVKVSVGRMRQIVPESFTFAFDVLKKGTIAKDARLDITVLPVKAECSGCDHIFEVEKNIFQCPCCKSGHVRLIQGKEIILNTIEGDS